MEIQVFGMAVTPSGDCTIASNIPAPIQFYDVTVSAEPDDDGAIEMIEEHENLTLDEANAMVAAMEQKYPDAGVSWNE
ncbi:MAG: hypothetical protein CML31_05480 [Rhizobiales bacterium]|nr:hypothetical protein [Hoeflea sp.]MBG19405.1 hypothetical protein [Hyphomicrobiales bacterium]|tara:strand:- start:8297 stop:8530 length:234 start_codon:yes stop_codon:yes gene_type:complete